MPDNIKSIWTEQVVDALRMGINSGLSASEIGVFVSKRLKLGKPLTRNQIIGKCKRMDLKLPGSKVSGGRRVRKDAVEISAPQKALVHENKPNAEFEHRIELLKQLAAKMREQEREAEEVVEPSECVDVQPVVTGKVTLLELRPDSCRWPIGDPHDDDFHFCGCKKTRGAYCSIHASLAYQPVRVRAVQVPMRREAA